MDEHIDTHAPAAPSSATTAAPAAGAKSLVSTLAIPVAIVIGFGLIAAAIFFSGSNSPAAKVLPLDTQKQEDGATIGGPIKPIDAKDHIRGNPNAPIMIVEYSDYDCPFCKSFHETMIKVMNKYAGDGKVAWVYRHFPIEQLHPSAPRLALASECVSKLGGNDAFWKYTDLVFGERGVNEFTNMSRLSEFAVTSGVSKTAFESCLNDTDGSMKKLVEEDIADGANAGAKGTPYTIVLVGGQQGVINGARPYEYVSNIIDTLLKQINGEKPGTAAAAPKGN